MRNVTVHLPRSPSPSSPLLKLYTLCTIVVLVVCSTFDEGTALGSAYSVPACFAEDAFGLLPLHERPPYRWFLVGGARSGSVLHVDPLATSAWNALLQGHKRCVEQQWGV